MSFTQSLSQPLTFIAFVAVSFILAREILQGSATKEKVYRAPIGLIAMGGASGAAFHYMKLDLFLLWFLVFYGLVAFAWHRKSDVRGEKLTALAQAEAARTGADVAEVTDSYRLIRRILSFALISYFGAFCLGFYLSGGR